MSTYNRLIAAVALVLFISPGCVRRTARFETVPSGARLYLNDEDVGETPVTVEFLWYGDYDVIYRKDGYETAKTNVRLHAPWYQLFPFDFVSEILWPGEIHDHHDIPAYQLTERQPVDTAGLIERAQDLRQQATNELEENAEGS